MFPHSTSDFWLEGLSSGCAWKEMLTILAGRAVHEQGRRGVIVGSGGSDVLKNGAERFVLVFGIGRGVEDAPIGADEALWVETMP